MHSSKSILIVEDDADLAELVRYNLQQEGYVVRCASDGATALAQVRQNPPDLILLDRMLPGISGDEVLLQLKREPLTASIPIIMVTAKGEESDALVGFALGADEYISKPFSLKLLLARTRAMLRRMETSEDSEHVITAGEIELDGARYEVTAFGQRIPVTVMEFRILQMLMEAKGRVLSRAQLIETVAGRGAAVTDRSIDVHVTALRKKLGTASDWIQTIRGIGYTFRRPIPG